MNDPNMKPRQEEGGIGEDIAETGIEVLGEGVVDMALGTAGEVLGGAVEIAGDVVGGILENIGDGI